MLRITKAKLFRRPNILIMPIYLIILHENRAISIFWTPCRVYIAFYYFGLSLFEKRLRKCSASLRQNISGDQFLRSSIQKMHFRGSLLLNVNYNLMSLCFKFHKDLTNINNHKYYYYNKTISK